MRVAFHPILPNTPPSGGNSGGKLDPTAALVMSEEGGPIVPLVGIGGFEGSLFKVQEGESVSCGLEGVVQPEPYIYPALRLTGVSLLSVWQTSPMLSIIGLTASIDTP